MLLCCLKGEQQMNFGDRIRTLRKKKRLTLEDVAHHLGVGRATVLKYEKGIITNVPSDKIELLSRLFDVSPAYLMGWTDDPDGAVDKSNPIVVPSSEMFVKIVSYMSTEDYRMVMDAFDRTYKKMKEMGVIDD